MNNIPTSVDAHGYLENFMRAGQDAMKQFDDALVSVIGLQTDESLSSGRPFLPLCFDRRSPARIS